MKSQFRQVALIGKYPTAVSGTQANAARIALEDIAQFLKSSGCDVVAASDRTGGVKLTIGDGKIRFESESPDSGEGFDEVPADYQGPELTVGFNARYFLDVLGAITDEEVTLGISGELDPAVIMPASASASRSYQAVIMPMRI